MKTTKLDMYEANVNADGSEVSIFAGPDKPYIIGDIVTELTASNHFVFLMGRYYKVISVDVQRQNYFIEFREWSQLLVLYVTEVKQSEVV